MPVFHPELGIGYYKQLVASYNYIALGGIVVGKWGNVSQMVPLIKYANVRGVRVHGLGFTRQDELSRFPFYSVDSTSWQSERFGTVYMFDGRTLRTAKRGARVDWNRSSYHNIIQWKQYAKFMEGKTC